MLAMSCLDFGGLFCFWTEGTVATLLHKLTVLAQLYFSRKERLDNCVEGCGM